MEELEKFDDEFTSTRSISLAEYASELSRSGQNTVHGEAGALWVRTERFAMIRFPVFELTPPSSEELRRVFWRGPAAVATYLLKPDQTHHANAFLYVCRDQNYSLEKLLPAARRNVRRGLKELGITRLTAEQVLNHGYRPYCDWLRRAGLKDETSDEFRRHFTWRARCPAHLFWGAWKDGNLASFISITKVDQWAEIDCCFSADALLHLRPNDVLFFSVLSQYLNNDRCRTVSYGVSSVQAISNKDGLHAFKTKLGFEAIPVRRRFVVHPLLRPFANRLTLRSIDVVLQFRPNDRRLKKAEGMLASVLGENRLPKT